MDVYFIISIIPKMFQSFLYTCLIILESVALSIALSIPVTAIRIKKIPFVSLFCEVWLSFIRSMPGILELFLAYFVLPSVLKNFGINTEDWPGTVYVLIALVFHYTPYISEILRPAYLSVDKGQWEAAISTGMTGFQTFLRIMAPQCLPVALPQLCNSTIDIAKDTSLLFTIGIIDLMGRAELIIGDSYGINKLESYFVVAIFYWVIAAGIIGFFRLLEKHYKKYKLSNGLEYKGAKYEH